ncbi:MAG: aminopeptidase P family protein [Rhodobacteraceae bacterium]|jgi:Xaa-Pro dipeptidase|nr:aminopeptidase P family protein [Paracoccaceae bacterium]
MTPDSRILSDDWADLSRFRPLPEIDQNRLFTYRLGRIRDALRRQGAAMVMLVNPITLRYAVDYRTYQLWQAHAHTTYAFVPVEGPVVVYNAYGHPPGADQIRTGRANTYFDGATELGENARLLAMDVSDFLSEIGSDNRRVAIEYVNPSLTQALLQRGLEVIDGVNVSETARIVKSDDEIACIRWAVEVAEHGIAQVKAALQPGVSELQLWGLLNYTNLANNGDWHNGRMLASGPRINPWLQEASTRRVEAGDLVGFDTDMVGPFGYFADISRTFHCGPVTPTRRQRQLYRLAHEEVEYNTRLIRPGMTLSELQAGAWPVPEEFHQNAYVCILHGVGMTDEFPRVNPVFRGPNPYDGVIEEGMVLCVESYMGAVGERDGVKLEQQVLVTADGTEPISTYPLEESLMS